jgi:hypothetical protein
MAIRKPSATNANKPNNYTKIIGYNYLFKVFIIVVCFLLGISPASEVYMPTFRNTLFHLHRWVRVCRMNWVIVTQKKAYNI